MTPVEALELIEREFYLDADDEAIVVSALPIARAQAAVCEAVRAWRLVQGTGFNAARLNAELDLINAAIALAAAEQAVPPAERGEEQR